MGGNIELYWKIIDDTITFALISSSTGWVGLGIGSSMADADMIVGFVANGVVQIYDCHSISFSGTDIFL